MRSQDQLLPEGEEEQDTVPEVVGRGQAGSRRGGATSPSRLSHLQSHDVHLREWVCDVEEEEWDQEEEEDQHCHPCHPGGVLHTGGVA